MNVRTTTFLKSEIDSIVGKGYFRNRTEAVNEALRLLIRRYKAIKLGRHMERIKAGTAELPSATQAAVESHEEEDEL